jgi:hypothetical protein
MTTERDFDRLVRVWLELSPDEAPDRVIAAVLQAADTTPQVRRSIRWPHRRTVSMTRLSMIATAALMLVLVSAGAYLLGSSGRPQAGSPSTSPATSSPGGPSGSPGAYRIPAELAYTWVGPKRTVPGMPARDRYRFTLTDLLLEFPADFTDRPFYTSLATTPTPGELRLVASGSSTGCQSGDEGRYGWSLSPGGVRLTLVLKGDPCVGRAAALAGDWLRVACKDVNSACLGGLEAGSFPSQFYIPRLAPGATWHPNWGALQYTVPAGWANSDDSANSFALVPASEYVANPAPTAPYHAILVFSHPVISAQNAACSPADQPGVGRSVDALVSWITQQASLVVSAPTPIDIDGYHGTYVDVSLSPAWKQTCPDMGGVLGAPVIREADTGPSAWDWRMSAPERWRLVLLDLGTGNVVAIIVDDSSTPSRFDELVTQAMPIIQAFTFQ